MGDKITSIAKLLEKIEQSEKHGCADDWTPEGQGYNDGLKRAIELIYEFEASVRERVKPKNFFGNKHPAKCSCTLCCIAKQILGGE